MKYVLDSSVAVKWVLPEIDSDEARRLRDDARNSVHTLIAPDVFPIEVAHALTRAERQKRIAAGEAAVLWGVVMSTPPKFARSGLLLGRAIDISSRTKVGVSDCLYVALAERRKCKVVSADDRLVRNLQGQFPFIIPLSSLP